MVESVSLAEFVVAFSEYGEDVTTDTWVWKDLSLDADELDWAIRDIDHVLQWDFHWSQNLRGYIPEGWQWLGRMAGYPDLKIRELYAFSRPTKRHD